ncbi:MAG: cytochrome C oxidase subunit II [Prolixibacteraceae bacterium]|nr:cytochrome C oxidase subunit II [Prolixibacteraceae bacterium]MBT6765306.1 cytochrome C oxidase subunit II [Prolixibacteraceae bacterium]MBT6997012.1 cytochrome C oxidase subunit II [Prolixibacteraceae bacterium]MBT7396698.1 cytochrome C oxidase subunit II [Prolixibacteraceae bacterium]
MVDSSIVLTGQTLAYTFYCSVIILLMIWFGVKVTAKGKSTKVKPGVFYAFVIFLTVLGVSLHIITYNTIPWTPIDVKMKTITADRTFEIGVENHEFKLPSEKLKMEVGEIVKFSVTSNDLTYGFGLFRKDNSMVMQMQVVPGHKNDILWKFTKPGVYSIRSTEYSGPKGIAMIEKDVVVVVESL